ncbi:MAG: redoxin family protein [Alphaproteobacteria bacterium]
MTSMIKRKRWAEYKGKTVVLEWNNPECPFVKKHYGTGNMQTLQKYAMDKGVVWLAINSGAPGKQGHLTPETAKTVLAEVKSTPTAYILDPEGKLGRLYGAKSTPHMFVIDKAGVVAYAGAIDDKPTYNPEDVPGAENYVKAAVDALAAGQQPVKTHATAYGCGVKYAD